MYRKSKTFAYQVPNNPDKQVALKNDEEEKRPMKDLDPKYKVPNDKVVEAVIPYDEIQKGVLLKKSVQVNKPLQLIKPERKSKVNDKSDQKEFMLWEKTIVMKTTVEDIYTNSKSPNRKSDDMEYAQ